MTTKNIFTFLFISLLYFNCGQTNKCKPDLNQIPEYGRQTKCREAVEIDNEFIASCDSMFKDRTTAAKYYVGKGWEYFNNGRIDTAMFRFNQAWLLDTTNADIYWGFGNILGTNKQFKESIFYFNKSLQLNPDNPIVWECIGKSYGQLFVLDTNIENLNLAIENYKHSLQLDKQNARVYGQLTAAYTYFMQKDSALKYLKITDNFDPKVINPEVREILNNEK